jgi:preprotein translocase subunit YajC
MQTLALFWQNGGGIGSFFFSILPFLLILGIFYFLVIVPQRRRQQEVQDMVASLKIGDNVVTNGGIIGKIIEVRETSFVIRSADKSNLEVARSAVVGKEAES